MLLYSVIIAAVLIGIGWVLSKISTMPDPRDKEPKEDPTDITAETHYDFRGNKSHRLN